MKKSELLERNKNDQGIKLFLLEAFITLRPPNVNAGHSKQTKYMGTDEKAQNKTIHIKHKLHMKQSKWYAHL